MSLSVLSTLLGGVGLFLVGMWLITDGLKMAAGPSLRTLLHSWTNTWQRGLVTGFLITALVQSSSATTVATIGFSNAGLLTLEQAIWVIFGSNVGTTMTGWIVALIGFKINIQAVAFPLIGVGMLLRLSGMKTRRAAFGQAIAGFGLFFLGIDTLQDAFTSAASNIQLPAVDKANILILVMYVLIGFLLTTVMQSSSAAIVITLSAAQSGIIPLVAAAAVVIGSNMGTTTTAIISVLGATPVAKRVAASHVMFNLLTACIAVIIIVPVLHLAHLIENMLGLSETPATTLALFHTLFNILGIILIWPLAKKLVRFLEGKFVTRDEIESRPKYLDKTVLEVPALAVNALLNELNRVNQIAVNAARDALSSEQGEVARFVTDHDNSIKLVSEIASFTTQLNSVNLAPEVVEVLPKIMETAQKYTIVTGYACDIAELQGKIVLPQDINLENHIQQLRIGAVDIVNAGDVSKMKVDIDALEEKTEKMESTYTSLKHVLLQAGSSGSMSMLSMDAQLQQAFIIRRMAKQIKKAVNNLPEIEKLTGEISKPAFVPESVLDQ